MQKLKGSNYFPSVLQSLFSLHTIKLEIQGEILSILMSAAGFSFLSGD